MSPLLSQPKSALTLGVFVAMLAAVLVLPGAPAEAQRSQHAAPNCKRIGVTVDLAAGELPTEGDDVILGTPDDDVINGLGGYDIICGGDGDDLINDGPGKGWVGGGAGDDIITTDVTCEGQERPAYSEKHLHGEEGNDTMSGMGQMTGGEGDDTMTWVIETIDECWFSLPDWLNGGDGDDLLTVELTDEEASELEKLGGHWDLDGGPGNDTIVGGNHQFGREGNDHLSGLFNIENSFPWSIGGEGDDTIIGSDASETLNGEAGNDTVLGGGGDDVVVGEEGNDVLKGGPGRDVLRGGDGDDRLKGGPGKDRYRPGPGDDSCYRGKKIRSC